MYIRVVPQIMDYYYMIIDQDRHRHALTARAQEVALRGADPAAAVGQIARHLMVH